MIAFISQVMHEKLILSLVKRKRPISLILDGTTTKGEQNHYLITYFMTLEDGIRPMVYFYKLILMPSDETAVSVRETLVNEWKKEKVDNKDVGFYDFMEQYLYGMGSDGAAVNVGSKNGLVKQLEHFVTDTPIFLVHCFPHRINLGSRKAMDFSYSTYGDT